MKVKSAHRVLRSSPVALSVVLEMEP